MTFQAPGSESPAFGIRRYFIWSPALAPAVGPGLFTRQGGRLVRFPPGTVGEALDVELLYRHASPTWGGRVAGLFAQPGASVFGLLVAVPEADFGEVEEAEGVPFGAAVAREVHVRIEGQTVTATAFTPPPEQATRAGPVSQGYAKALAYGAEQAGLPSPYVTRLQAEAMVLERVQGFGERRLQVSP